jgi:hypothetical protein
VMLPLLLKDQPLPQAPNLTPIRPTSFDSYEVGWTNVTDANAYTLQEAPDTTFTAPVITYSGPSTAWQASAKPPRDYCYRVRASNQSGNSPWSNARCITLAQLRDDFSNPASGWPVESDAVALQGYASGEYRILAKQPQYVITAGPDLSVTDFRCQIDARNASHINGTYGIVFAATDAGYYLYEVGFGQFRLSRYERWGNHWTTLVPQQQHPAIHQGALSNRLAVVKRSTSITLYANDVPVGQAVDGLFASGYVGAATTGQAANYDVRFDNFLLAYAGGATQSAGSAGERIRTAPAGGLLGPE